MKKMKFAIVFLVMGTIFSFYPSMAKAISLPKDLNIVVPEPNSPGAQIFGKCGVWNGFFGIGSQWQAGEVTMVIEHINGREVIALYYTPSLGSNFLKITGEFDKNFEYVIFFNEKSRASIKMLIDEGKKMRLLLTKPGAVRNEAILSPSCH